MQKLINELAEQGIIKKENNPTEKHILSALEFDLPVEARCFSCNFIKKTNPVLFAIQRDSELNFRHWLPGHDVKKDDNFFGVNRSLDWIRLAGQNISKNLSEQSEMESILHLMGYLAIEGAKTDILIVPMKCSIEEDYFLSPYGKHKVIKSEDLAKNEYLCLQSNTWIKYPNTLVCTNPGYNGRLIINQIG